MGYAHHPKISFCILQSWGGFSPSCFSSPRISVARTVNCSLCCPLPAYANRELTNRHRSQGEQDLIHKLQRILRQYIIFLLDLTRARKSTSCSGLRESIPLNHRMVQIYNSFHGIVCTVRPCGGTRGNLSKGAQRGKWKGRFCIIPLFLGSHLGSH